MYSDFIINDLARSKALDIMSSLDKSSYIHKYVELTNLTPVSCCEIYETSLGPMTGVEVDVLLDILSHWIMYDAIISSGYHHKMIDGKLVLVLKTE